MFLKITNLSKTFGKEQVLQDLGFTLDAHRMLSILGRSGSGKTTLLKIIAGRTHPQQRAESIGVFRLWRDLGYAIGALLTGIIADWLGLDWSVAVIGGLTVLSAGIVWMRMK
ncbi:MAG: ATP-binding cassette domain-containing protein [Saprospiraceae bacterium]|nr:ATP-binding cassette domain-containing protein [Saprospiraceae bacterium]